MEYPIKELIKWSTCTRAPAQQTAPQGFCQTSSPKLSTYRITPTSPTLVSQSSLRPRPTRWPANVWTHRTPPAKLSHFVYSSTHTCQICFSNVWSSLCFLWAALRLTKTKPKLSNSWEYLKSMLNTSKDVGRAGSLVPKSSPQYFHHSSKTRNRSRTYLVSIQRHSSAASPSQPSSAHEQTATRPLSELFPLQSCHWSHARLFDSSQSKHGWDLITMSALDWTQNHSRR